MRIFQGCRENPINKTGQYIIEEFLFRQLGLIDALISLKFFFPYHLNHNSFYQVLLSRCELIAGDMTLYLKVQVTL